MQIIEGRFYNMYYGILEFGSFIFFIVKILYDILKLILDKNSRNNTMISIQINLFAIVYLLTR